MLSSASDDFLNRRLIFRRVWKDWMIINHLQCCEILPCWWIGLWSLSEITFSIVKFCPFLPLALPDRVSTCQPSCAGRLALCCVDCLTVAASLLLISSLFILQTPSQSSFFWVLSRFMLLMGLLLFENEFCAVPWPAWDLVLGQGSLGLQQSQLCLSVGTAALCQRPWQWCHCCHGYRRKGYQKSGMGAQLSVPKWWLGTCLSL